MGCKSNRYVYVFLLLLLVLSGCSNPVAELGTSPPIPKITVHKENIDVLQGSYCWIAYGKGSCVDMISPGELLQHHDYKAIKASPGEKVTIQFAGKPRNGSMSIQYETGQKLQDIPIKGSSFFIPDEEGTQIYSLSADWGQGKSASFVFSIKVEK